MSGYYIVVADQGHARTFRRAQKFSPLQEETDFDNPRGRAHAGDLVSDQAHVTFASAGSGEDAKAEGEEVRDVEADRFAKRVSEVMARESRTNGQELIVIAAPQFLGRLRKNMDNSTARSVALSIDKDLVKAETDRIREEIDRALRG